MLHNRRPRLHGRMRYSAAPGHGAAYCPIQRVKGSLRRAAPALDPRSRAALYPLVFQLRLQTDIVGGNWKFSRVAIEQMTDLKRFSRKHNRIKEIITTGSYKVNDFDKQVIKDYAKDFYETWTTSSSEVIFWVEPLETAEILLLLRSVFKLTWPSDALNYFASQLGGIPNASDKFQVFRGEPQARYRVGKSSGFSWSANRDAAKGYTRGPGGVLLEGTVSFKDILFMRRTDGEVVALPGAVVIRSEEVQS